MKQNETFLVPVTLTLHHHFSLQALIISPLSLSFLICRLFHFSLLPLLSLSLCYLFGLIFSPPCFFSPLFLLLALL